MKYYGIQNHYQEKCWIFLAYNLASYRKEGFIIIIPLHFKDIPYDAIASQENTEK